MSKPFSLAVLYGEIWKKYFEGSYVVDKGKMSAVKHLTEVPQDEFLEKARIHCTDLWHQQNCKGSIYCFSKYFEKFTVVKKPERIRQRVTCNRCDMDYFVDEKHSCGDNELDGTPSDIIKLFTDKWKA